MPPPPPPKENDGTNLARRQDDSKSDFTCLYLFIISCRPEDIFAKNEIDSESRIICDYMYIIFFAKNLHLVTKILTGRTLRSDRTIENRDVLVYIFYHLLQSGVTFAKIKFILKVE